MVPTQALVAQQLTEFRKYLSKYSSIGLCGDATGLPLRDLITRQVHMLEGIRVYMYIRVYMLALCAPC